MYFFFGKEKDLIKLGLNENFVWFDVCLIEKIFILFFFVDYKII